MAAGVDDDEGGSSSGGKEEGDDGDDDIPDERREQLLRKYALERLLYFFGVIECDSPQTAMALYAACDGADFGDSGNVVDLRFVPDEQTFDAPPRDVCTSIPHNYNPPNFESDASKSRVEVNWDTTPADRLRVTMHKHEAVDLNDEDFAAYLASSGSDDEDDDDEDGDAANDGLRVEGEDAEAPQPQAETREERAKRRVRERYKVLLEGISAGAGAAEGGGQPAEEQDEMIITFQSGLQEAGEQLLERKAVAEAEEGMTLMEKRKLKKARQKREHKERVKRAREEEGDAETMRKRKMADDDDDEEEDEAEALRREQELELLVMDERKKDFKVKKDKLKGTKKQRQRQQEMQEVVWRALALCSLLRFAAERCARGGHCGRRPLCWAVEQARVRH